MSEITIKITDLSRGGAGIAREESGRVVFVPYTAPGDEVKIKIHEEHKNYAQGQVVKIVKPSLDRVSPRCSVFGRCGGCQWQHIPYALQWKTKVCGVKHALERVKVEPPADWSEYPSAHPWNYRNRVQLRGLQNEIGFFAAQSHELIPTNSCPIARTEINESWSQTQSEGSKLPRPYKVEIEVLPSGKIQKFWNSPHGAAGFRQVNEEQNEKLRTWVSNQITPHRELLDLFGGSGNLSAPLAEKMQLIHCVDLSTPETPLPGTPQNLFFHRASVLSWLLKFQKSNTLKKQRSAILDPPRQGWGPQLSEMAHALETLGVTEIISVGCDPDHWAKDLSRLIHRGWRLEKSAVFDFFPQTPHVEAAAKLVRPL